MLADYLPRKFRLVILAVRERYVSGRKAVAFAVGVPVGLAAVILAICLAGRSP